MPTREPRIAEDEEECVGAADYREKDAAGTLHGAEFPRLQQQSKALTRIRSWSRCERSLLSTPETASRFNRYYERCRETTSIGGHEPAKVQRRRMPDERRELPAAVSVVPASELGRRFPDTPADDDHLEPDTPRQVHRSSRRLQSLRPRRNTGNVNIL